MLLVFSFSSPYQTLSQTISPPPDKPEARLTCGNPTSSAYRKKPTDENERSSQYTVHCVNFWYDLIATSLLPRPHCLSRYARRFRGDPPQVSLRWCSGQQFHDENTYETQNSNSRYVILSLCLSYYECDGSPQAGVAPSHKESAMRKLRSIVWRWMKERLVRAALGRPSTTPWNDVIITVTTFRMKK